MLETPARAISEKGSKKGFGMSMSPELAEGVYLAANWVLIAALMVGVLATIGIVVSGSVRVAHLKREEAEAQAKGEKAKAESAVALLEIAKAYEHTALLEKEAAEARAEQERIKQRLAGRRITSEQYQSIASALNQQPMSIIVSHVSDDPEAAVYAEDVAAMLEAAGATVTKSSFAAAEPAFGIELMPTVAKDPNADRIGAAFRAAGVAIRVGPIAQFLTINVWSKPAAF